METLGIIGSIKGLYRDLIGYPWGNWACQSHTVLLRGPLLMFFAALSGKCADYSQLNCRRC